MLTSGTMTNRLDRLAERGLVARVADPADRRSLLVELTAEGRKLVDRAVEHHVAREEALVAPLTRAEQKTLDALARKLLAAVEPPEL